MPTNPKILVVALETWWPGIARLPKALQETGFEVGLLCFEDSHLAATRFRDRLFLWPSSLRGGALAGRLKSVVREWHPDFLVAGDEKTVVFLSSVFRRSGKWSELAALLKFSLGQPASIMEATSKRRTIELARRLNIRVPESRQVCNYEEIFQFIRQAGLPIVLKRSSGSGGAHVAVCRSEREAAITFWRWRKKFTLKRRISHWWDSVNGRAIGTRWLPVACDITANQFIAGKTAMSVVAAFEGKSLGTMLAIKEQCFPHELAPSSVARFIHNAEMRRISEKMIAAWGLTGFIGFDFIIDAHGEAWLLECNPRPTSITHLGARVGEDICRALYCRLTGQPLPRMAQEEGLVVAHFPQELRRDPKSHHLTTAFHDVPVDDPGLLEKLSAARR